LEEKYNLEDALVVAMQLNAFIRHARSVKMANIAQIVNVIAPVFTSTNQLILQTIFYPFEIYRRTCGRVNLDIWWEGDTFSAGTHTGIRVLDVTATLDEAKKQLVVYVVNRSQEKSMETVLQLTEGVFNGQTTVYTVNGKNIKAENTFKSPETVKAGKSTLRANGRTLAYTFEPHSITALVSKVA
jgi:alpha-N-arabinofuranosidase